MDLLDPLEGFHFSGLPVSGLDLRISKHELLAAVLRRMGYARGGVIDAKREKTIGVLLDAGIESAHVSCEGHGTCIESLQDKQFRAGKLVVESAMWAAVVKKAAQPCYLCCFMLTLGPEFDRLKNRAGLFESYALDCLGSELAERIAELVEDRIRRGCARRGLECSRRFSPGYCDWQLGPGQKSIASFLDPASIGVEVLSSGAMVPTKSISAVVIISEALPFSCPCSFCGKKDCSHRCAE